MGHVGGKVALGKAKTRGGSKSSGRFVSGLSQVSALSVSSGLVSNVVGQITSRETVPNPESVASPAVVCGILKVSDIAMLDKLEGGLVTESEDGLAVMFEADSDIESKLTDTLRAHLPAWKHIGAGVFATCTVHLFC